MFVNLTDAEIRILDIKLRHADEQLSYATGRTQWEVSADMAARDIENLRGDLSDERDRRYWGS